MTSGRRRVLLAVLTLVVAATCVRLGIWQLERLDQRRESNDRIRDGLGAALVVLNEAPGSGAAHRRARAVGTYDTGHEVVLFGRSLDGRAGDHLLTPLRLSDGSAVLVDRGWVPTGRRAPAVDQEVRVRGLLLPAESTDGEPPAGGRVTSVDPVGIALTLPYELSPVYLLLQGQEPQPGSLPIPVRTPELSDGPHLGYAIQWFSFAGVAVVGGVVLSGKERRAIAPAGD